MNSQPLHNAHWVHWNPSESTWSIVGLECFVNRETLAHVSVTLSNCGILVCSKASPLPSSDDFLQFDQCFSVICYKIYSKLFSRWFMVTYGTSLKASPAYSMEDTQLEAPVLAWVSESPGFEPGRSFHLRTSQSVICTVFHSQSHKSFDNCRTNQ